MAEKTKETKACIEKKESESEKIDRRKALKRIARNSGSIALLAAFPGWRLAQSVFDETNIEGENKLLAYYVSYSSWYSSYYSHYYSLYSSYVSYSDSSYTSYHDSPHPDPDYESYYSSFYKPPKPVCFIDTLMKAKK